MAFLILGAAARVVCRTRFAQSSAHAASDQVAIRETDVSKWTHRKWNAAKAKRVMEKDKWNIGNEATRKNLRV
jgi:hypothetical protein